jgi:GGDEF domain-containing protein
LVAQSDNGSILKSANADGVYADRIYISQSSSPIIKAAAKWVKDVPSKDAKKFSLMVGDEKFFGHVYSFSYIPGLMWKITILIPESDLLGTSSSALQKTLMLVFLIAFAGIFAGLWIIERMTVSITRTAKAASLLSQGDLSVRIDHTSQIAETHTLINTFNHMSSVMQKTVVNLQGQVQFDEASELLTRQGLSEKFMGAQPSKIAILCLVKLHLEKSLDNKPEQISSDLVLKAVSSRLLEKLPENTACARIEGDVLAVLYTNLNDNENTHDYAILTQTVFESPFIVENLEINLQTHIGFTSGPLENRDLPLWIRNANQAMRKAIKKQTKNPENFNP